MDQETNEEMFPFFFSRKVEKVPKGQNFNKRKITAVKKFESCDGFLKDFSMEIFGLFSIGEFVYLY